MSYLFSQLSFWLVLFFLFGLMMGFFSNSSKGDK
jgi:hypothetical protein